MTTLWNKTPNWFPLFRRDDWILDAVVADAKRRFADTAQNSIDELRAAAQEMVGLPPTDAVLAKSLALFAVAARGRLNLIPFDVQYRAAAAMTLGRAVELHTGEGKTLAVAAAAATLALQSRRVHVATVNQYLANRDFEQFAPVMRDLGISAGLLDDRQAADEKRRVYGCSVVYGTGYAFGFDYLREQLRLLRRRTLKPGERLHRKLAGLDAHVPCQPPLDCTIVDELDAVLLDEAGVPLILSDVRAGPIADEACVEHAAQLAEMLRHGEYFTFNALQRTLTLNDTGLNLITARYPRAIALQLRRPWRQYVEDALTARHLLRRDVDYVVGDGRIWIVDAPTGRIFDDRRWPEGLQRAVEFFAGVPFSAPTGNAARITRQRFFKLYRHLTGTSGTLAEARAELASTYGLKVCLVPPRLPSRLAMLPTRCFRDAATRNRAAVAEAIEARNQGRPVLVGCRTIEAGNELSRLFNAAGVGHQVLNGIQTADEADVVRRAGRSANILVATNLAGRGTDIRLDDDALNAGGLHVVGVEYHESPRIDRQLIGRWDPLESTCRHASLSIL